MTASGELERTFRDTVAALSPHERVAEALSVPSEAQRISIVSVGKAAVRMAAGAVESLGDRVVRGLVVAPAPCEVASPLRCVVSAHPTPDERSVAATQAALALVAAPADLVVALVSGGASSLLAMPAPGLTLADKVAATSAVYAAGADIESLNVVRKHLSAVKGGRLAAAACAPVLTLVASDVVGDALTAVGSGLTVPDASTFADAARVIEGSCGWAAVPTAVRTHVAAGMRGELDDTPSLPRPGDHARLLCGIESLSEEAARVVRAAGGTAELCVPPLSGSVAEAERRIASHIDAARHGGPRTLVFAGECTIALSANPGIGGRAQHLALSLARRYAGIAGISVLVCGSDGIDGNSPAAGAVVDGATWAAIGDAWGPPEAALDGFDAYSALSAVGAIVVTGPTGVNHADLVLVHVQPGW